MFGSVIENDEFWHSFFIFFIFIHQPVGGAVKFVDLFLIGLK